MDYRQAVTHAQLAMARQTAHGRIPDPDEYAEARLDFALSKVIRDVHRHLASVGAELNTPLAERICTRLVTEASSTNEVPR